MLEEQHSGLPSQPPLFPRRSCRRTYIALIDGCARASKSDAAYQLYKSLRAQGMEADGVSGSALIVSLCHASQARRRTLACAAGRVAAACRACIKLHMMS